MGSKVFRMMLLCFSEVHLQDVLLLEHRYDCIQGQALLVPVKSEGPVIGGEAKWLD